jgi:hypothetical protein
MKFMAMYNEFQNSGWHLHFLKVPRIGHPLGDEDVLDFCRSNPRPVEEPGRVEWSSS